MKTGQSSYLFQRYGEIGSRREPRKECSCEVCSDAGCVFLFAANSHHNLALSRLDVAFQVKDLLPGSEYGFALSNRHGKVGSEGRCLEMGVTISISPGSLMSIVAAGRHQSIEDFGQVLLQPRFEFNRADSARAAHVENVRRSGPDAALSYDRRHLAGQVLQMSVARSRNRDSFLKDHAGTRQL